MNQPANHRQAAVDAKQVLHRFCRSRELTERLAAPLSAEDQTAQSMPDTSPTKWHRAHVTWFFETFLLDPFTERVTGSAYEPFHPRYNYLFNSYYEAVGERHPRPQRGLVTRPGADEIGEYRRAIDARVRMLIEQADPSLLAEMAPILELGLHHEQQHQELLLMDIKHLLSMNAMEPVYSERQHHDAVDPGPLGWVDIIGGTVTTGRPSDAPGFGFDNESPQHEVLLGDFQFADRLITAGEWLEFMADGGYDRAELWLSDGWYKRIEMGWVAPLYWRDGDATRITDWRIHTLHGTREVDLNEPVCHVSFYEADAFATWAKRRLPTELEWEHVASTQPSSAQTLLPNCDDDLGALHPTSAGAPTGHPRQLFGSCWEWTESAYRPYPGYRPPPGAIGEYNGKFMINTMVLRGGSAFTPPGHVRATYRNFFHPHTRWHLSGVRLADDA